MKYAIVHHDMMAPAISPIQANGCGRPKTTDCRYLQRPHLTIEMTVSYRNHLPATINIHQDKDLRRQMATSRCQNDIKCRWDNELERETRNKNAVRHASRAAFTGFHRDYQRLPSSKSILKGAQMGSPTAASLMGSDVEATDPDQVRHPTLPVVPSLSKVRACRLTKSVLTRP